MKYRIVKGDRFLRQQCFSHIDEAFVLRPGLSGLWQISLQSSQPRCSSQLHRQNAGPSSMFADMCRLMRTASRIDPELAPVSSANRKMVVHKRYV